jgi:uncharacterized protein (TIGR00369 family)
MTVSEGKSIISLELDPKYHMGLGLTHGSVYFRLLDDACFYACMSLEPEFHLLTGRFQIEFLKPVIKGKITATGIMRHQLKRVFFADATLLNEEGEIIAIGSGQFMRSKIKLSTVEGYVD